MSAFDARVGRSPDSTTPEELIPKYRGYRFPFAPSVRPGMTEGFAFIEPFV